MQQTTNKIYIIGHVVRWPLLYKFGRVTGSHDWGQGFVSLTFRKFSKINLRKYTMPETTFMVRISSSNFACVPKAMGTRTKFQSEILIQSTDFTIHKFRENISESSQNVSETPPGTLSCFKSQQHILTSETPEHNPRLSNLRMGCND